MKNNLRNAGIDVLGDIPWGTHFCQFYQTKEDLLDLLVPYFKAGLENNEFCLWTTCDPLTVDIAFNALKKAVPDFDRHVKRKSIEIIPSMDWYIRSGKFDGKVISKAWIEKLQDVLKRGYEGMRVNANEAWLESGDWERFMQYERELNTLLHNLPIIILCTYPISRAGGEALLEVAHAHEWVVTRREGRWEILEEPEIKKIKSQLKKESEELKRLVAERTWELERTVEELKKEISERKETEDQLSREKELSQTIKESFPGIFKIIDENYRVLAWNRMFEEFTGYSAQEIPHLITITDLHDISDRTRALDLMQQGFVRGTVSGDFKIRTKDGSIRQVFFIGQRINYKSKSCLLICGIDITERKKAEELLRYEKDLSNGIIESIPGYLLLIDKNYRIVLWNKQFPSMFGYTEQETASLHPVESFFHQKDWTKIYELIEQVFSTGYLSGESTLLKKDGSELTVYFNSRSIVYNGAECVLTVGVDITERKKAEEKIKRQAELTNEIIDAIPIMIWCILPDGRLDFVNQRWMEYTGLSLAEARESPTLIVHPEDRQSAMKKWELIRDKGNYHEDEMRLQGTDGTYRWFLVRTAPLRDKDGKIVKWFGVSIDIEDRKQAEEQIRESSNLLAEAEKIAHVGSWSLDLRSYQVAWSDELYRMFGIKKSEFDHSLESVFNLIHPDDRDFVRRMVEEALTTHAPYNFYLRRIMPDKKVRIIHARGAVMTDAQGNAVRMYGASQDVTERKQAEDELRLAYQRLSYHVENTPLGVIEWDKDLNITRWSEQAEKIFGWKASEVLGRNRYDPDFPIVYKEEEEKVAKVDYELMQGLVDRNLSLNRNYTKDGKVIYCEWYNSVLRDEKGSVITILSLIQDVTERKRTEEKLSESYEQIRSLSEHLTSIREEERKYIAREIHDELGQYLTVLKMDVGVLQKKLPDTDDLVQRKLKGLSENIDKVVHFVRRIASELRPTILDELGLGAAIAWHLEEFEKRSGIKAHFTEQEEELEFPEPVKTNLFRIVQESLTNVARHSKATDVKIDLARSNGHLTLTIADNGIGLALDTPIQKKTMGILGMKERTAIIGGTYDIQSTPGKGTLITVTVPLNVKPGSI